MSNQVYSNDHDRYIVEKIPGIFYKQAISSTTPASSNVLLFTAPTNAEYNNWTVDAPTGVFTCVKAGVYSIEADVVLEGVANLEREQDLYLLLTFPAYTLKAGHTQGITKDGPINGDLSSFTIYSTQFHDVGDTVSIRLSSSANRIITSLADQPNDSSKIIFSQIA